MRTQPRQMKKRVKDRARNGQPRPEQVEKEWVTRFAVADDQGVSERTVRRWKDLNVIPYRKVGNVVKYNLHDVDYALCHPEEKCRSIIIRISNNAPRGRKKGALRFSVTTPKPKSNEPGTNPA